MAAGRSRGFFQARRRNGAGALEPGPSPLVHLYKQGTVDTPVDGPIYRYPTGPEVHPNPFSGDTDGNVEWFFNKPEWVKVEVTIAGMGTVAFDYESARGNPRETLLTRPGATPDAPGEDLGIIFPDPVTGRTMWRYGPGGMTVPLDHLPEVHVDDKYSSMDPSGEREHLAIKKALDEAYLSKVVDQALPGAIVRFRDRYHFPHRSINMLRPFQRVLLWGAGQGKTVIQPTALLNGGDNGVTVNPATSDPQQFSVFNAANPTLATHMRGIGIANMTIDGVNMTFDGLEYGWTFGPSLSGAEFQDVDFCFLHDVELINLPNGATIGSTIPSRAGAIYHCEIQRCRFENNGLIMHHYRTSLRGRAPGGLASQAGFMFGGIIADNYYKNNAGPWYTAVGNHGTIIRNNIIEGGSIRIIAFDGSVGTFNVDFGLKNCYVYGNISRDAGGYVLNGKPEPTFFNGMEGQPSAIECLFDDDVSGTALMDYPDPPALTGVTGANNSKFRNPTGQDAAVIFSGAGTVDAVRVGDIRNDGTGDVVTPNVLRSTVVPNGMSILPSVTGAVTWEWWLPYMELPVQPAAPVTSPFNYTNSTGAPVLITILPLATNGPGGALIGGLSIPDLAHVVMTIDTVEVTPTGQKRNMFYLAPGSVFHMEWVDADVQAALRAYHNGAAVFSSTGSPGPWEWKVERVRKWESRSVPASGTDCYNPLASPMAVQILTGSYDSVGIFNADGSSFSTVQVTSSLTGLKGFMVPAMGYYTPVYTVAPTVKYYVAPNGLRAGFYGDGGSVVATATLGLGKDNEIRTRFSRMPQTVVLLRDMVRTIIKGRLSGSEWSPGYTVDQMRSGVAGSGSKETWIDGALMVDDRLVKATAAHVHCDGTNDNSARIRAYMTAVSSPNVVSTAGSAGRYDTTGSWGPGVTIEPDASTFALTSGATIVNPHAWKASLYLIGSGTVTDVTLGGQSLGTPRKIDVRVGGSVVVTFTGSLDGRWVPV